MGKCQRQLKLRLKNCFCIRLALSCGWDPFVHSLKKPGLASYKVRDPAENPQPRPLAWSDAVLSHQAPAKLVQMRTMHKTHKIISSNKCVILLCFESLNFGMICFSAVENQSSVVTFSSSRNVSDMTAFLRG